MTIKKQRGRGRSAPSVYKVVIHFYERGKLYYPGDEIWLTPDRASALRGMVHAPEDKMVRVYETK